MKIRQFRLDDYATVFDLWKKAGLLIMDGDEPEGVKLKLQRDPELFLVAKDNGEIVGTVMGAWDGRRGWIYHLAVRADHLREKIGAKLVTEVERRLIEKGAKRSVGPFDSNDRSLKFFKAAGYEAETNLVLVHKPLKKP